MARGDTFPLYAAREPFFDEMWPAYETEFETPALGGWEVGQSATSSFLLSKTQI